MRRDRMKEWSAVSRQVSRLAKGDARDAQLANILLTLMASKNQVFDADELVALDRAWGALFAPAQQPEAEAA